jgi:hypothetical protein
MRGWATIISSSICSDGNRPEATSAGSLETVQRLWWIDIFLQTSAWLRRKPLLPAAWT